MHYTHDEIGTTLELITTSAKDTENLKFGDTLLKYEGCGKKMYLVSAITSLSVIVVHTKPFSGGKLFETAIPKEKLSEGSWEKLVKVVYLPNDGSHIQAYINRCVIRGWWKKAFEYAKEFHLMWYLEKQCEFVVDGLDLFIDKNKLSLATFKTMLDEECWEKGQEFTQKQLIMIEKAKGN